MRRYWRPNQAFLGPVKRGGKNCPHCNQEHEAKTESCTAKSETGSGESATSSSNDMAESAPAATPESSKLPTIPVMTRRSGRRVHFPIEVINSPIKNAKDFTSEKAIASQGTTVYDRSSNSLIFSVVPRTAGRSQVALDRIPFSFRFGRR